MKKFTRLWQLMFVVLLTTSVAFGQKATTFKDAETSKKASELKKEAQVQKATATEQSEFESLSNEVDENAVILKQTNQDGGQVKTPKWNTLKSNVPGGATDDLFCPTTPGVPIFAEDANGYSSAGTADVDAGYRIYQPWIGDFTVTEIHFWYIHAYFDGTGWGPCALGDEEPVDVEIGFWNNGAGVPGTNVATYNQSVTGVGTGIFFASAYEIYEYQYVLPASVTITDGWVSLMGSPGGDATCWFMWVNSDPNSGPVNGYQEDIGAGTGSDMGYPVSLCIYGTNNMVNNVGVSAVTSPVSGPGLTATELVTINIFNTGSADHLTGFPVEFTYLGTTYTEPYPGPLPSGGTDTYTFIQTIDASAVGAYTFDACTALPGDELLADDCMPHAFTHFGPYDCDWEIVGYDDYGDTWNNGYIDIYLDGDLHHTWTGPATTGPDSFFFGIYDPCVIDIVWNEGGWPEEASYYVYDNYGIERANDGLGGVDPTGIVALAADCAVVTCPPPTAQTVANITPVSADLGWTESGTAIQWQIEVVLSGSAFTDIGTTVFTNPYTWGGLAPGTAYDWQVKAECSPFDHSTWLGPNTFTTGVVYPDLLDYIDAEGIVGNGDNQLLGAEYFGGSLWVTSRSDILGGPSIYEIDYVTGTLLSTYPQGTTSTWGMRDMADDGIDLYAGDDNGFYQINPTTGVVTTLFTPTGMGTIRALAYDPSTAHFYTKSFSSDVYEFDAAGTIYNQWPGAASAYGAAFDPNVPCIWWHASGGASGMEMVQMLLDGTFTGVTVPVPQLPCGPANNVVGGAFMDFGNMYTGRDVFGVLDQNTPDHVKIFEAYDTGHPDQTSNHVPLCGAIDVPTDGTLTWTFGVNTVNYDLYFGVAGSMAWVDGGTATNPGSWGYSGLAGSTTYEWQVFSHNGTGTTDGMVYYFTTAFPPLLNDDCASATAIGEVVDLPFSTTLATADTYGTCMTSPNIWYNYTATIDGDLVVSLCGSSYDTKLAIYDNFDCALMVELGCNDDYCGLQSQIDFGPVTAGTELKIEVGGYSSYTGNGILNVIVTPKYLVSGIMSYANGTTMNMVTIDLDDGTDVIVATAVSDLFGYFEFTVPDGSYTYMASTTKPWGGLSMNDVQLARQYVTSQPPGNALSGLPLEAGDVDLDGFVLMNDVQAMRQQFTSQPPGFVPFWIYEGSTLTVAGADVVEDEEAICGGDTDASYVPLDQLPPPNDPCTNPEAVAGPYPVTGIDGTTLYATNDCPVFLDQASGEVWYAIDLPYAQNDVVLGYCGDALMNNGYIVGTLIQCSCLSTEYLYASSWVFAAPCVTDLTWLGVPGPGTFYYPVSTGDFQEHFVLDVDVSATPAPSGCEYTAQYPSGSITPDPAGAVTTISTCNFAGEHSVITGIIAGKTYEFTMSDLGTGAYITVTDGVPPATNIWTFGTAPVQWTATTSGDLYVHWSLNGACGTDSSCHTTTVQCIDCP